LIRGFEKEAGRDMDCLQIFKVYLLKACTIFE